MEYNFREIEKKWQQKWIDDGAYKVSNHSDKPKYYVLDMFPYPSGAGLHVGHPLGYVASDITARYKRLKGFNVLHPMGYDAFGLPAEQYAIEHGVHPAESTAKNIATFRSQLDKIGFSYDWSREVNTSHPKYYKWTQWIFLQLFDSFFNRNTAKTEPIEILIAAFEKEGNKNHPVPDAKFEMRNASFEVLNGKFSADQWKAFDEKTKRDVLMEYRIAYCGYGEVNWCEALGTVLANDEVVNGVSERGGYPVEKKRLRQWYLRITEYADRLLQGLQTVDFSDAMKDMQSNWIGKSSGAEIEFAIKAPLPPKGGLSGAQPLLVHDISNEVALLQSGALQLAETPPSEGLGEAALRVYTTRPDTIFGVDFMVIAPEHELVNTITTPEQKTAVEDYITYVKSRSERERMAEKKISGVATGAYAINPFNGVQIPIWISEYVLAGYGTGAIMAVPSGDERDYKFAKHFNIPVTNIIGDAFNGEEANPTKDAVLSNSGFLDGMVMRNAIDVVIDKLEEMGIGKRKVNFKMRDAAFSRQRYWGEPFPIKWIDGVAYPLNESGLPLELPHVEKYGPGPEGEGPLSNIPAWTAQQLETNTMPGYAGSSWYFLRYMDPHNEETFCDKTVSSYWNQVDLYVGGTEHAVGHLLYSRMWTKCLYDLGLIGFDEPFKKLLNQGMIVGYSFFIDTIVAYEKPREINLLKENESPKTYKRNSKLIYASSSFYNSSQESLPPIDLSGEVFYDGKVVMKLRLRNIGEYIEPNNLGGYRVSKVNLQEYLNDVGEEFAGFKLEDVVFDGYLKKTTGEEVLVVDAIVEKMSKSKFNTVNPNDIVERYGADTFRMYEMFLGPIDQSKPWDTKGIEGVHRFIKKLWRLFFDELKGKLVTEEKASPEELKVLHRTIKKIEEDTERFSYNTAVSAFMVCVNELTDLKCHTKEILEQLLILLTPYAPHVSEELWSSLGHTKSILDATYPTFNPAYLVESTKEYPVSINGKLRTTLVLDLAATPQQVEEIVLKNEVVQKWIEGKEVKKFIFVPKKMVNVVV